MLTTYLTALPYTKFVLIEDSLTAKGSGVLEYLVKNHEKRQFYRTHIFVFEGNFNQAKNKYVGSQCHDFTSDLRNWVSPKGPDLKTVISNLNDNCVVVVDSLVPMLYRYGVLESYQILSELKNKSNVQQIMTVLHRDLLDNFKDETIRYFKHLSTLHMELEKEKISYTYKKGTRKVIKQVTEYRFENGKFITEVVKKSGSDFFQGFTKFKSFAPKNMSTFKIGLSEKDKESRDNLVLPYLPKEKDTGAKIHYAFDDVDDWDEEDPDDDLDI